MREEPTNRPSTSALAPQHNAAGGFGSSSSGHDGLAPEAAKIELPKGGGALRGIGEKVSANLVTGTGSMTVPIAVSPGRSGFGPLLALSYDSGFGNGPFGLGWNLSLPAITRKTDKGLPRYLDVEDSDVFLLSGAEDLIAADGSASLRTAGAKTYQVRRYRPRIEGLFARIERWTNSDDSGDVYWRSISRDNITTWYGKTTQCRISDPNNSSHVFAWLICESHDDKGNAIVYDYVDEDDAGVDLADLAERQRQAGANRYIKRIRYGNLTSRLVNPELNEDDWLFEVVFDYDEDHVRALSDAANGYARVTAARDPISPDRVWPLRADAFSSHRAGFEVRTRRLCRRVLMFHLFEQADLEQPPPIAGTGHSGGCLVKATEFSYSQEDHSGLSLLSALTQVGFRWRADEAAYWKRSLPKLEFEYSRATISSRVCELDAASLENLPRGLDGTQFQWVDLDGEGLSGVLTRHPQCWYYKPNRGAQDRGDSADEPAFVASFGPAQALRTIPTTGTTAAQLLDLAGDGRPSLAEFGSPLPGFYKRGADDDWAPFVPFQALPHVNWNDPNLRFVDLTGDGHADVLVTEDSVFTWYPSRAEDGFGPGERVDQGSNEDAGARLVFADGTQSIYLADMSGDGLTDLVRIRNGGICYWPNRGYGRFGPKVTMRDSPWFDAPDLFEQRRIGLADIDGSGCTDIIYLAADGPQLYFNQSGNGWSGAIGLAGFPPIADAANVTVIDLLGTGTMCLVWSSVLAADAGRPLRYVDLMGSLKPHLLVRSVNHLGAETRIHYLPSTHFYLRDKRAGCPWITRLPFPVQVVASVETIDFVSRNRFTTRYAYHHGHYDGVEREYRGFGMVEQWDTEQVAALIGSPELPASQEPAWDNLQAESQVPPVYTKTWFHTGAYLGRDHISDFYAGRLALHDICTYYREPGLDDAHASRLLLADSVLPDALSSDEARDACRALKGAMLRQEVYALDGTVRESHPYTVTEQNFTVECLQPRRGGRHAVFFTHTRETVDFHYERHRDCAPGTADPRVTHSMTLEVDAFGNVKKAASIAYGRRGDDTDPRLQPQDCEKQRLNHVTYTDAAFTGPVDADDAHRTPLPAHYCTYELRTPAQETGATGLTSLYGFDELAKWLVQAADGEHDVPYEDPDFETARRAVAKDPREATHHFRRPVEMLRTLYRPDDCGATAGDADALLALGGLESLALPGESYRLALTAGLVERVFQRANPDAGGATEPLLDAPESLLGDRGPEGGGYVDLDGDGRWWLPSGRVYLSPKPADDARTELAWAREHFFRAARYRDALLQSTCVEFDAHDLFAAAVTDALGNCSRVLAWDYRVLQPRQVMDPNRNRAEVAFDTMGMVVGSAVMGKPEQNLGDRLDGFEPDPGDAVTLAHLADPHAGAASFLGRATTRLVHDLFAYERSQGDSVPQPAVVYTLARETHDSDLTPGAEPACQHSFCYSDGFGREIQHKRQAEPMPVAQGGDGVSPRWVARGWAVFDNKGRPVRKYEPFFSDTPGFEFGVKQGVSAVLFYDPVGRVVATLHPDHTYEKVVHGPWRQTSFDASDTTFGASLPGGSAFDSKMDPDVGHFFQCLADGDYLPTWHHLRTDPVLAARQWSDPRQRNAERSAALKAAAHAGTPTTTFLDTLGRAFITFTHNRVACPGHTLDGTESHAATRTELDIQGNVRWVRDAIVQAGDALGRIVIRHDHDMLGNRLHQVSMDAGERWTLGDVSGRPIRAWDSRGHEFTTAYDALRRPITRRVRGTTSESDPRTLNRDTTIDKIEYGEAQDDAEALNLRTRVYRHFDAAGVVTHSDLNRNTRQREAYDFKGNLLRSTRQLTSDYRGVADWWGSPELEEEYFASATRYDALNRPIQAIAPHSSRARVTLDILQPVFNVAGLLVGMNVWLQRRGVEPAGLLDARVESPSPVGVSHIEYDAKGQRQRIDYLNGTSTFYEYDAQTFRLMHLLSKRNATDFPDDCPQPPPGGWPGCQVQNLSYVYDPVGNITRIQDDAQQTVYFRNRRVEPSNDYTYDAVHRLVEASGREHMGQQADGSSNAPTAPDAFNAFHTRLGHPGNGNAMGTYAERYVYDAVGNFLQVQHRGLDPAQAGWTRSYEYLEASLIEAGKQSNRLSRTQLGNGVADAPGTYLHDMHGSMVRMPHLGGGDAAPNMHWDCRDRLRQTNLGGGGTAYYLYDAAGQRVRKVWEKSPGLTEERIYLGGFEVFRRHGGPISAGTAQLERETLHVMDDRQRIALVETRTLDTSGKDLAPVQLIRYQFSNHLGSASLELDDQARIVSYEEYAPYGSSTFQAVRRQMDTAKRYRFTGKERDEESGLYYHEARYHAPWLARWIAVDPEQGTAAASTYCYCNNSPACSTDPTGRAAIKTGVPDTAFSYSLDHGISRETIDTQGLGQQMKVSGSNLGLVIGSDNFSKQNLADTQFPSRPQISLGQFAPGSDAFRRAALEMFKGSLKDVKELNAVWQEASRNETNTYKTSATNFYEALRVGQSPEAVTVREGFAAAGVDFDPKSGLPRIIPESILPSGLLDKMSVERSNPTQRMMEKMVAASKQVVAASKAASAAAAASSTAKAVAGTAKQAAKSLVPGSDVYDAVKGIGAGSAKSGLSILAQYSKTAISQGVQVARQYGVQATVAISAAATATGAAAQAAFSATSLTGIAAAGSGAIAVSVGAVALAGAAGYAVGTAINKLVVEPLVDKLVPQSFYEWSYRTFYR